MINLEVIAFFVDLIVVLMNVTMVIVSLTIAGLVIASLMFINLVIIDLVIVDLVMVFVDIDACNFASLFCVVVLNSNITGKQMLDFY